jgi:hypothetical protein
MILFGDDYQLPTIGNGGATNIPQLNKNSGTKILNVMPQCQGGIQFMNLAEEVMGLDQVCRQTDDQLIYKGILERLHLCWMNEQDEARLRVSYKFCDGGPAPDKARFFLACPLCMMVSYTKMYWCLSMLER